MRKQIHPAIEKLGITKRIGWHTFRHSYSTLLRQLGIDIKVQQGSPAAFIGRASPSMPTHKLSRRPSEVLKTRSCNSLYQLNLALTLHL
jgi:integrase